MNKVGASPTSSLNKDESAKSVEDVTQENLLDRPKSNQNILEENNK